MLWLASHNGGVVNGSHVGLLELLRVGVVTLQYQVMSYRHSNNESDTPVMIVTQLLRNEGVCVVFVCVCVGCVGGGGQHSQVVRALAC